MNDLVRSLALVAGIASLAAAQAPPELPAWAANARVDGPIVRWCRGELRPGRTDGYAVAVASADSGGRYLVISPDLVTELARFTGKADLSCYTPAEARKLDAVIRRSDTIQGEIAPAWNTAVVCAFIENTSAVCWQYSPTKGVFVKVGQWTT